MMAVARRVRRQAPLVLVLCAVTLAGCSAQPSQLSPPSQPSQPSGRSQPSSSAARTERPSTAPESQDITDVAPEIIRADPRVADLHAENPYEVVGIFPKKDNRVGVTIEFEELVPPGGWPPGDACEIGGTEGRPATGLDFVVDLRERRVIALSPRWGSISCMEFHS